MGFSTNQYSAKLTANGIVLPDARTVAKSVAGDIRPPLPRKGFGGRLGAVYGTATAAGVLKLYDAASADATKLVVELPVPLGGVQIEPPEAWRFIYGVYAEFTGGLAGTLSLTFI